jgi:hypothetical protein
MPTQKKKTNGYERYILNCNRSEDQEDDWTFEDAIESDAISKLPRLPRSVDLREEWWAVRNQKDTGACVGFATADGLLRWHMVKAGKISKEQLPSPRFIWMANKETDDFTVYPSAFLEKAGTQAKLALKVARKYGCVLEDVLPMEGPLSLLSPPVFYTKAARLRISSYHNIGTSLPKWKKWLASQGPILTRLNCDRTWMWASYTKGRLIKYFSRDKIGGHAVAIVGYTPSCFIIRNSWGTDWGDGGFAYASIAYVKKAFKEAYGLIV